MNFHNRHSVIIVRRFYLCERCQRSFFLFFFNDTATTEIYTLSLHDALPISRNLRAIALSFPLLSFAGDRVHLVQETKRSEEHTSELQSPDHLVCRLLLEKKKKTERSTTIEKSDSPRGRTLFVQGDRSQCGSS